MRRRSPLLAFLAIAACGYGLWTVYPDLRYALEGAARPSPPAELLPNRHLLVKGAGEPQGFRVQLSGDSRDVWLLPDRKVIVLLPAMSEPAPGELAISGRLFRGDRAKGWQTAAAALAARRGGGARDYTILVAGEEPAVPWGSGGIALLLLLVFGLNIRWLALWFRKSGR